MKNANTLYFRVISLPSTTNIAHIKTFFSKYGEIEAVHLKYQSSRSEFERICVVKMSKCSNHDFLKQKHIFAGSSIQISKLENNQGTNRSSEVIDEKVTFFFLDCPDFDQFSDSQIQGLFKGYGKPRVFMRNDKMCIFAFEHSTSAEKFDSKEVHLLQGHKCKYGKMLFAESELKRKVHGLRIYLKGDSASSKNTEAEDPNKQAEESSQMQESENSLLRQKTNKLSSIGYLKAFNRPLLSCRGRRGIETIFNFWTVRKMDCLFNYSSGRFLEYFYRTNTFPRDIIEPYGCIKGGVNPKIKNDWIAELIFEQFIIETDYQKIDEINKKITLSTK